MLPARQFRCAWHGISHKVLECPLLMSIQKQKPDAESARLPPHDITMQRLWYVTRIAWHTAVRCARLRGFALNGQCDDRAGGPKIGSFNVRATFADVAHSAWVWRSTRPIIGD